MDIEVRLGADGGVQARRLDRRPMTPEDWRLAEQITERQRQPSGPVEGELSQIIDTWRRLFRFSESHQRIAEQIRSLRQWQTKSLTRS